MKKVAIVQSDYVPWKDYFDMIAAPDEFLFDDIQYAGAIGATVDAGC